MTNMYEVFMIADWSDFGLGIVIGVIMTIAAIMGLLLVMYVFDSLVDSKAAALADERYEERIRKFWKDRLGFEGKDLYQFERDTAKQDLMGFELKKGGK